MNDSQVIAKTPLMAFIVDFLRGKPDASYHEVQSAGAAASFQVAPINYGNARRMLGMASKARAPAAPRRRRLRQVEQPTTDGAPPALSVPATKGRRGRKRKLDFSNLSTLVGELQDVVAERDRLLEALDQIAVIIRNV